MTITLRLETIPKRFASFGETDDKNHDTHVGFDSSGRVIWREDIPDADKDRLDKVPKEKLGFLIKRSYRSGAFDVSITTRAKASGPDFLRPQTCAEVAIRIIRRVPFQIREPMLTPQARRGVRQGHLAGQTEGR
jgi:hypothetical protein